MLLLTPHGQPDATDILTQMPSYLFYKKSIAVRGQRVESNIEEIFIWGLTFLKILRSVLRNFLVKELKLKLFYVIS